MKRTFFLTVLFTILVTINVLGQSQIREGETTKDTIITLVNRINDTKTVILLENKDFIVKVSLFDFKENFDNWLKKYPHLEMDREVLKKILKQVKSNNIVNASKILESEKSDYWIMRLGFRIADLLENGQCLILNKGNNEIISEIKMQTHSYICGPLCGSRRKTFLYQ
ncbi:MAG: hypothetical protein FWH36_09615 [Lentimicrobiaceae bacterium]|nr:hypothetical protein [Lentimicrobiaceae bacterium]